MPTAKQRWGLFDKSLEELTYEYDYSLQKEEYDETNAEFKREMEDYSCMLEQVEYCKHQLQIVEEDCLKLIIFMEAAGREWIIL